LINIVKSHFIAN